MACRTPRKRRSNESHLESHRDDPNRVHRPSPTTLTRATMEAAAANQPQARLSRSERDQIVKLTLWPFVGDTRNQATVRPRVGDRERNAAAALLRTGKVAA